MTPTLNRTLRCNLSGGELAPDLYALACAAVQIPAADWEDVPPHLRALLIELGTRIFLSLGPCRDHTAIAAAVVTLNNQLAKQMARGALRVVPAPDAGVPA